MLRLGGGETRGRRRWLESGWGRKEGGRRDALKLVLRGKNQVGRT